MNEPTDINFWFGFLLQFAVMILAISLSEKRTYHRPFAVFAFYVALSDPVRWAMRHLLPYAARGLAGRVLMIVDPALFIGEPIILAIAAIAIWAPVAYPFALRLGILTPIFLAILWPRGLPENVLLTLQIISQCAIWIAFLVDMKRSRRWGGKPTGISVGLAGALQFAILFGPYISKRGVFASWGESWGVTVGINLGLVVVHISWLSGAMSESSTPSSG